MALATVDEVATRLGWPPTDEERAKIEAFLDDCTALIEQYCVRDFEPRTDEAFVVAAEGGCFLPLPRRVLPYITVSRVEVDGTQVSDWTMTRRGLVRDAGWDGLVTVTGSWGYSPVPADLRVVCAAEVIRWMTQTPGLTMERTGEREVEYDRVSPPQSLSETAKQILRRFRPSVGTLSLTREGA